MATCVPLIRMQAGGNTNELMVKLMQLSTGAKEAQIVCVAGINRRGSG
jgi:hypothetical protein